MRYSLLRESRVVIHYEGRAYEFDALSNVSAGIDYQEYKTTRKTLHKRRNYPLSKVVSKNPSDISLAVNLTDNQLEINFFRWLGLKEYGTHIMYLPDVSELTPVVFDMYIITKGSILRCKHCFVSAVDFTLEKAVPLLNIAIEGADVVEAYDYPDTGSLMQGNILTYSPLRVNINNNEMPALIGAGISFQQQCNWREQRTIHDIGKIYTHKTAIVSEMNASATINFNFANRFNRSTIIEDVPLYNIPVSLFNRHMSINFPNSKITKRLSVADVYSISFDVIPLEESEEPVTIQFFGEN